jgi:putative two-component system response regulator
VLLKGPRQSGRERGARAGRAWGDEVAETKGRVLVVDDESYIRDVITRKLSGEGYTCEAAADAEAALALLSRDGYDCVVTDINMPGLTGIELLRRIRLADQDVAVIMITGAPDLDGALEAMRLGAYDHQAKPLNLAHLALTVDRAVEKKRLILENRDYQRNLESMVLDRTKQLHQANDDLKKLFMGTIKALAQALEAKDEYTQGHSARVAEESVKIARYLSLSEIEVQDIWLAGYLHDIGKIGIKESVLNKPGKLDPYEWECIQMHPVTAEKILAPIDELADVIQIVRHHHERFDGSGYPDGIRGSQIPLGARILSVADSYDALTSKRSYREALSRRDALAVLEQASGTQFDPVIVRAYLSCTSNETAVTEGPRPRGGVSSVQDARTGSAPSIDILALKHSNPS